MIWTPWKPLRPNNPPFTQARKRFTGAATFLLLGVLLPGTSLVLSGTAATFSLPHTSALMKIQVEAMESAQETPGYGITGYFSLEGEGGSAIRAIPRSPAASSVLDIHLQGGRLRVTSSRAEGGMLALRLIDAQGRVVRKWNEIFPPGGTAVVALDGQARGLLILQVDGGELGRAVKIIPPLRAGTW